MVKIKVNNYKSSIEDPYSKIAWMYDVWSSLTESKALNLALKFAAVKNGERFLEVAVGTGKFFEQIVKLNPKGINEGIDISEPMLERARRRAKKYKNVKNPRAKARGVPGFLSTRDLCLLTHELKQGVPKIH